MPISQVLDITEMTELLEKLGTAISASEILSSGLVHNGLSLTPIGSGRNNWVLLVVSDRARLVCKAYFDDSRHRFDSERRFLDFASACGLDCVPVLLAQDLSRQMILMSFLEGRHLLPGQVDESHVVQAGQFVARLNANRSRAGTALPNGAEACFCIGDHVRCVDSRVDDLSLLDPEDDLDREAVRFVHESLVPRWSDVKARALVSAGSQGFDAQGILPASERCISPSDIGFHNALIEDTGHLNFVDFEYAGWDDPAKLVCDFALQVDVPVSPDLRDVFAREALATFAGVERVLSRVEVLMPVYRIKWACILLNDFLEGGRQRRRFARTGYRPGTPGFAVQDPGQTSTDDHRSDQLRKANSLVG